MNLYILDEKHNPILCPDLNQWSKWYEDINNRLVKRDYVSNDVMISTVFLGIGFANGPSMMFETLVFGGPLDHTCERYTTWNQAVDGHEAILNKCKEAYISTN